MQVADLYVRVSTDEQTKGYSPRSQEAVLREYCQLKHIEVRSVFYEDYTAKHFNRPEWNKIMVLLRRQKNKTNLMLFTKWDRFSRNASDAYQIINTLKKLGVEPQAIEQPLDLTIPENKMMLAIYLTAPEIENDRRGLNTKAGIRQAKKEGRYMGKAPRGYINETSKTGKKFITIKEPEASIMRWVFNEMAEGLYSAESIMRRANEKGLGIDKNTYLINLRNPVYCGKIRVPQHLDEPAHLVQGLHEPLISEELFFKVQDIMDGRSKVIRGLPIATPKDLPLRNFVKCNKCARMLTGSASKGRKTYRVYYHCRSSCGIRYRAEDINNAFIDELTKFIPRPGYAELFKASIINAYNEKDSAIKNETRDLIDKIDTATKKTKTARELMLSNDLEPSEYRKVREEMGLTIARLESRLNEVRMLNTTPINIKQIVEMAVNVLCELDSLFELANNEAKRYLIGLLFPEKLTFSEGSCRNGKLNEAAELIYLKNKKLREKKKKTCENLIKTLRTL
ncbi:recombinase family protein [Pedobacter sp. MC2016-05]|uniref:recombinase family protein n=1 Tax=Pedobacter sp. MC2016-05 TaxID=2994474 RepID=UPI002245593B|nr:recombinase family protein [Pedobacter sp. MC2016-05]MCX2476045.1 recombinase family protein [Pedobacter sp. MC2016-05]